MNTATKSAAPLATFTFTSLANVATTVAKDTKFDRRVSTYVMDRRVSTYIR